MQTNTAVQTAREIPATPPHPRSASWRRLVEDALAEDVPTGDVTTELVIAPDARGAARIEARASLVVCGMEVARE